MEVLRSRQPNNLGATPFIRYLELQLNAKYLAKKTFQNTGDIIDHNQQIDDARKEIEKGFMGIAFNQWSQGLTNYLDKIKDLTTKYLDFKRMQLSMPSSQ